MLAIRNYGLLWDRDIIHFGRAGVSGHLIGYNSRVKKADFRKQSGVYVLYDKDMKPVYVGQAGSGDADLFRRLKHHDRDHLRMKWDYFSWFGLCKVNNNGELSMSNNADRNISGKVKDALNEIEGVLILAIEPKLNKQGPKWKDAEEFNQYTDEEVEEVTTRDLLKIQERIENRLIAIENRIK